MVWSPKCAANAYLDTLKLFKDEHERNHEPNTPAKPESSEFISALAAGTSSQLIVEVSSEASQSTIALAAAARQTGGHLICILPHHHSLIASQKIIDDNGLHDQVVFKVGDPYELLSEYENIDFSLVDCNTNDYSYTSLLKMLDMNPRRSVVVANNLDGMKEGLGGDLKCLKEMGAVRSMKNPIGNGMEVTMIGTSDEFGLKDHNVSKGIHVHNHNHFHSHSPSPSPNHNHNHNHSPGHIYYVRGEEKGSGSPRKRVRRKSDWVMKVDEKSGEEHIFRVPKSI